MKILPVVYEFNSYCMVVMVVIDVMVVMFSGYGDVYPLTSGERVFNILFILIGIIVIYGTAFSILADGLLELFSFVLGSHKKDADSLFLQQFSSNRSTSTSTSTSKEEAEKKLSCRDISRKTFEIIGYICSISIPLFGPAFIIGYFEEWTFIESVYFAIVTSTTVGYGDLTPKSKWTRLGAIFYLPLCITIMAKLITQITSIYVDRKMRNRELKYLQKKLTMEDMKRMDIFESGSVKPVEFLAFTMLSTGKVTPKFLKEIMEAFRRLDVNKDGKIDMQDLVVLALGDDECNHTLRADSFDPESAPVPVPVPESSS